MTAAILIILKIIIFLKGWQAAVSQSAGGTNARLPIICRVLLSLLLVTASLFAYLYTRSICSRWVLLGMLASFLGDLSMAEIIPFKNRLAGGMFFFGIAHILYIISYAETARSYGMKLFNPGFAAPLLLYGLVAGLLWAFLVRNPENGVFINAASAVYAMWLGFMASCAAELGILLNGCWWITSLGALLFTMSDLTIGATGIGKRHFKNPEIFIWLTYVAGQAGIIYAPWIGILFNK